MKESSISRWTELARPNMQLDETVEIGRGLVVQWFKDKNFAQNARFDRKPVKSINDQKYVAEWQMRWAASFWTFWSIQIIFFVKRAHNARACQYWWPFILIYWYQFKEKRKTSGQKQHKIQKHYKCIMTNTNAIWHQAAHTTYHLQAAQQE